MVMYSRERRVYSQAAGRSVCPRILIRYSGFGGGAMPLHKCLSIVQFGEEKKRVKRGPLPIGSQIKPWEEQRRCHQSRASLQQCQER